MIHFLFPMLSQQKRADMRISSVCRLLSVLISSVALSVVFLLGSEFFSPTAGYVFAQTKSPKDVIKRLDNDGDGKVSRDEWPKPPAVFKTIDSNGDGYLTLEELQSRIGGGNSAERSKPSGQAAAPSAGSWKSDLIDAKDLDPITKAAFLNKFKKREHELARGVVESDLIPVYPDNARCPSIDHIFGEPWKGPIPNRRHLGADIPAGWNEPIMAMADGTVVAKFTGEKGFRGLQVVLRHAPEDTGLPVWLYTLYAHFNSMPKVELGQRVRMGQILGPNGKSGIPSGRRKPHLHLTVNFSSSPKFSSHRGVLLVPMEGYFIDPVALFHGGMPIDTHAMRTLPDSERRVRIAYKLTTGEIVPPNAKIIWPFACRPK